jgi:hypothetical protein
MMKFIATLFASTLLIAGTASATEDNNLRSVRELNAPVCEPGAKFDLNPIVPWCAPEGVIGDSLTIVNWLAWSVCQKWYIYVSFCLDNVDSVDWYLDKGDGDGYQLFMSRTDYPYPLPGCQLKLVYEELDPGTVFSLKAKALDSDGEVLGEIEIPTVEYVEYVLCESE